MLKYRADHRLLITLGVAAALAAAVAIILVTLWVVRLSRASQYPGAIEMSEHFMYKFSPSLSIRHDTAYRSSDEFPKVYNWYSTSFDLGPEVRAQSACNAMDKARSWFLFENTTTVTICDTPNGRMMFVMQSVTIRRDW